MNGLLVGAAPGGSSEHVASLARCADYVVAVDGGGALCLAAGVTPDVVVGDLDSLPEADRIVLQAAGVPFRLHPVDKDETDTALAIEECRRLGVSHLTFTGVLGARFDHSLAGIGALFSAIDLHPRIEESDLSLRALDHAHSASGEVEGAGATFSVIAVDGDCVVSIVGAKWPLDHAALSALSPHGISNVVAGRAEVLIHHGRALLIAPTVGGVKAVLR